MAQQQLPSGDGLNSSQRQAVANVVANDAAKGAEVYAFNPNAAPEDKAAVPAKKSGMKSVFGAPKALGRGVTKGVTGVGKGVVNVGTQGVGAIGHGVGAVGGAAIGTVGAVGGVAVSGVGAVAGGAKHALGSMPGMGKLKEESQARAVAMDTSTSDAAPVPTVSLLDAQAPDQSEDDIPGTIPKTVLPGIPYWMPKGWKEVAGIEGQGTPDAKTAQELSVLSSFLKEQYYGQWYHNAGIIVFAVIATRFITVIRLGWGWVFIILAFCATAYSLSIQRTRQRARDDIQRELVKTRLVTETESADWLNGFLDRFWLIYEPILSQTIVASVDAALVANTPGFLDSIRLTTFTLGTKAPRIDYVRTFPKTPDDVVIMDWAVSFTPNDIQDLTPRQTLNKVNPKIVLTIRLGKGVISTGMPILLEDMSFQGKMRIKLKLMSKMPHVQRVEMSFIEKPVFDFVLKPIGGETLGFDINNIPGLEPFIKDQVHANLGPMMYDPNVFTLDLEQMLSGEPLDAATGVVKVTILDARGLKATKLGGGDPDPYVALALGGKPAIATTKTIMGTNAPTWNESHFVLISSLADTLNFNVFDFNDHRPDSLLGTATQELASFADDAEREGIVAKIVGGGKDRGELRYDISYYPSIAPVKKEDGTFEPVPDIPTGIVRLQVHQAKDFPKKGGDLAANAKVFLGGGRTPIFTSKTIKKSATPAWEEHTEFIVADKNASVITVQVNDTKGTDEEVGRLSVKLSDILAAKEAGNDWFPLSGGGKLRLSANFKPVAMAGVIDGAASYVPPIGILRIWIKNAQDLKNIESLGGKSDPYLRVMNGNKILARTEVQNNNLNPVWDEIIYVPVHSLRERVVLEVMDYENIGKDRSLGKVDLEVADCAAEAPDNVEYPYQSTGHQVRADRIRLEKNNEFKGQLLYEVDFKPAVSLRGGISFEAKKNDLEVAAAAKAASAKVEEISDDKPNGTTTAATAAAMAEAADKAVKDAKSATAPPVPAKDGEEPTEASKPEAGVEMSPAQLLAQQSGILVFQVISGQLARKGALEVLFDEAYWPAYTSERARSNHAVWDQVGEGFVRELDFGQTWLRINASEDTDKEEIVAELKMDTKEFLERALDKKADFVLARPDGSNRSIVTMSARYDPVAIQLEPRESVNNQGQLRVTLVSGKGLRAADRGGKSDPNVAFSLNDMKVFKSETKKKTVNPVWNETFQVAIPSRTAAKFKFEVNDYNTVGTADELGEGLVNLAALEPFQLTDVDLPVVFEGKPHGTIQLKLLFSPEIIARTRAKTSTFSSAGRTMTAVGGAALGAPVAVGKGVIQGGGAVIGGVGHGVGAVVSAPGRLFKRKDKSGKEILVQEPPQAMGTNETPTMAGYQVPGGQTQGLPVNVAAGQVSAPAGTVQDGIPVGPASTALPTGEGQPSQEPGTLTVAVLGAKSLAPKDGSHSAKDMKPYVQVKVGSKAYKTDHQKGVEVEFNESFNFNIAPGTSAFDILVFDKHSFGKDTEIGEAQVDIWRHIQPAVPTADVFVELSSGTGQVKLRLDWQPGVGKGLSRNRSRTASVSSSKFSAMTPNTPKKE